VRGRGRNKPLAGTTVITTNDGKRYCKKRADRLRPYLLKPQRTKRTT
jgi:hypothetical protein